jgi:hypothetical protein
MIFDPQQSLLLAVNNYTESNQDGHILIEKGDMALVRQYVEVPAATRDGWGTVETEIELGKISEDTHLGVTATFGNNLNATDSITLDCSDDFNGDAIYVQIEKERNVRLIERCYDKFPSAEAVQGGVNQS